MVRSQVTALRPAAGLPKQSSPSSRCYPLPRKTTEGPPAVGTLFAGMLHLHSGVGCDIVYSARAFLWLRLRLSEKGGMMTRGRVRAVKKLL